MDRNLHELARRAAESARFQRRHGSRRPLRELFCAAYSLLRYLHGRDVIHA